MENFEIDRKIGKGQFSVVYKALCKANDTTVALKKVQIFEMMDAKARLDCMKEIQLLQVLKLYQKHRFVMSNLFVADFEGQVFGSRYI